MFLCAVPTFGEEIEERGFDNLKSASNSEISGLTKHLMLHQMQLLQCKL